MAANKLNEATFVLGFTDYEDVVVDMAVYHTKDDDYGNKTVVSMHEHGCMPEYLDTRYDTRMRRDASNFVEWCKQYFADRFGKRLTKAELVS